MRALFLFFIWGVVLALLAFHLLTQKRKLEYIKGQFAFSNWSMASGLTIPLMGFPFWACWPIGGGYVGVSYGLGGLTVLVLLSFLALRLGEFSGARTISDIFGRFYGSFAKTVVALFSIWASMGALLIQFAYAKDWWETWSQQQLYFMAENKWMLLGLGGLLILYAVWGGGDTLWMAHLLHCILVITLLPLIGLLFFKRTTFVPLKSVPVINWSAYLKALLWGVLPLTWHRGLWQKHSFQIRKSFWLATIQWSGLLFFITVLFGVGSYDTFDINVYFKSLSKNIPLLRVGLVGAFILTCVISLGGHLHHLSLQIADLFVNKKEQASNQFISVARWSGVASLVVLSCMSWVLPVTQLTEMGYLLLYVFWGSVLIPLLALILGCWIDSSQIWWGIAWGIGWLVLAPWVAASCGWTEEGLTNLYLIGSFLGHGGIFALFFLAQGRAQSPKERASFWASWALKQSQWQRWQQIKTHFSAWWDSHNWWMPFPWKGRAYLLGGLYGISCLGWVVRQIDQGKHDLFHATSWFFILSFYLSLLMGAFLVAYPLYSHLLSSHNGFFAFLIRYAIHHLLFWQPLILLFWSQGAYSAWVFWVGSLFVSLCFLYPSGIAVGTGLSLLAVLLIAYFENILQTFDLMHFIEPLGFFESCMVCLILTIWMFLQRRVRHKDKQVHNLENAYEISAYALQDAEDAHFGLMKRLQEEVFWPLNRAKNTLEESKESKKKLTVSRIKQIKGELQRGMHALESLTKDWHRVETQMETCDLPILLAQWKEHAEYVYPELVLVIQNQAKTPVINLNKNRFFNLLDNLLRYIYQPGSQKEHPVILFVRDVRLQQVSVVTPPVPCLGFTLLPAKITSSPLLEKYNFSQHIQVFQDLSHRGGRLYHILDHVYTHYGAVFKNKRDRFLRVVLPITPKSIKPLSSFPKRQLPIFSQQALARAWYAENRFRQAISNQKYHFDRIQQAITFAKIHHAHQRRRSGEPYYIHLWEVAERITQYDQKEEVLLATILHDTLTDTYMNLVEIYLLFGHRVAMLVDQVTRLHSGRRKIRLDPHFLPKDFLNSLDKEAALIKLCDRWHNLDTLHNLPFPKRKQIILETERFYLPLAEHFGYKKLGTVLTNLIKQSKKKSEKS